MRPLHRMQHPGEGLDAVMAPLIGQLVRRIEPDQDHLQGFPVHVRTFRVIDAVIAHLERRYAAPDSHFEAPAAHLIEHADLLHQAQRMVQRQTINQRPEAKAFGALCNGGQEQVRRRRHAQRRRVMLGHMVGADTDLIVALDQLQPVFIIAGQILTRDQIEMVEYAEFHEVPPNLRVV